MALEEDRERIFDDNGNVLFIADRDTHSLRMFNPRYEEWWLNLSQEEREPKQREMEEREARFQSEQEKRRLRSEFERCGIPAKDIARVLGDEELAETPAVVAVREFLRAGKRILVLSGVRGCGKTTAASLAAASPYKARDEDSDDWTDLTYHFGPKPSLFIEVGKLERASRYEERQMAELECCDTLVVDDLGMEYADKNGFFLSMLDGLINSRYASQRRTVITTNLPAKAFKERYGERIADRIREVGTFVELDGESLRGKEQRQ